MITPLILAKMDPDQWPAGVAICCGIIGMIWKSFADEVFDDGSLKTKALGSRIGLTLLIVSACGLAWLFDPESLSSIGGLPVACVFSLVLIVPTWIIPDTWF